MPTKRQATLTLSGPEDQTVVLMADFDQLTLTRTQVGGYQREPNGAKPIESRCMEDASARRVVPCSAARRRTPRDPALTSYPTSRRVPPMMNGNMERASGESWR